MANLHHNMQSTMSEERLNTFDGSCIDPRLLTLQQNNDAVASGSTMDLISTAGNTLAASDAISHEAAAGRGFCSLGGHFEHRATADMVQRDHFEHMKQSSHKGDVHFTSIKNAAEKPKCACGDGLIVSGVCKACRARII